MTDHTADIVRLYADHHRRGHGPRLDRCETLGLSVAEVVRLGTDGRTGEPFMVHRSEAAAVREALANLTPAEDAAADPDPSGYGAG